jgi:hypothetical protein
MWAFALPGEDALCANRSEAIDMVTMYMISQPSQAQLYSRR